MRAALGFLTVVGGAAPPDRRATSWFGAVGALVGAAVGGAWWLGTELWPPLVAAVLAVTVDAALTGFLHLDGLADSADGLLPPVDRARRLAIMATPDVGAFGMAALVLVLLARVAALATMTPDVLAVAGLWAAARAGMGATTALVSYARETGIATGFAARSATPSLVAVLAGLAVAAVAVGGWAGLATALAAAAGFAAVIALAVRRLGGYTGDVLGAAGVVAETVGLLVAAARW